MPSRRPSTWRARPARSRATSPPAICCACRRRWRFGNGKVKPRRSAPRSAPAMEAALNTAIDQLDAMRTREGTHLAADLSERKDTLCRLIGALAEAAENGREELEARLMERVKELLMAGARRSERPCSGDCAGGAALGHHRGGHALSRAPRALGRAGRRRRAMRAQARFPAAGDEPRDQHHRLQGRRSTGVRS